MAVTTVPNVEEALSGISPKVRHTGTNQHTGSLSALLAGADPVQTDSRAVGNFPSEGGGLCMSKPKSNMVSMLELFECPKRFYRNQLAEEIAEAERKLEYLRGVAAQQGLEIAEENSEPEEH